MNINIFRSGLFLVALLAAGALVPAHAPAGGQREAAAEEAPAAEAPSPAPPALPADSSAGSRLAALGFQLPQESFEAPAFQLQTLEGRASALEDYRGKIVFLNFWATWCPPCRAEMPSMETLYRELGDEGLVILAVDLQEEASKVAEFVREYGLSFPVLLDSTGRVGAMYGARSIPTSYLLDRQGRVLARTIGGREWDDPQIIALFRELLAR